MAGTITAQQSFDIAMALTDNITDNADYLSRAIPVINNILPELYQFSDTKTVTAATRPLPTLVTAMTNVLTIDNALALSALPHGMIARLFLSEDPTVANYHEQKYLEAINRFRNVPQEFADITDLYDSAGTYSEYDD